MCDKKIDVSEIDTDTKREKYLFASKFLPFVNLHKYLDLRVCRFV